MVAVLVMTTFAVASVAVIVAVPVWLDLTVNTACPDAFVKTEEGVITVTWMPEEIVTVCKLIGLLLESLSVTVTTDVLTPLALTEVGEATTVELVGLGCTIKRITVTSAVPNTPPEVALTVTNPAVPAVRSPEELIVFVPIVPSIDQVGVIETVLL